MLSDIILSPLVPIGTCSIEPPFLRNSSTCSFKSLDFIFSSFIVNGCSSWSDSRQILRVPYPRQGQEPSCRFVAKTRPDATPLHRSFFDLNQHTAMVGRLNGFRRRNPPRRHYSPDLMTHRCFTLRNQILVSYIGVREFLVTFSITPCTIHKCRSVSHYIATRLVSRN